MIIQKTLNNSIVLIPFLLTRGRQGVMDIGFDEPWHDGSMSKISK